MSDYLSYLKQNKKVALALATASATALGLVYMYKRQSGVDQIQTIQPRRSAPAQVSAQEAEESKTQSYGNPASTLRDANFTMPNIHLYSHEAELRDNLLDNVSYKMLLRLGDSVEDGYQGSYSVKFDLKGVSATKTPIFLDFQGKQIGKVTVNGQPSVATFNKHRIDLPLDKLRDGTNEVTFDFENTYVDNSAGLHFYRDPQDDKVYIYSHLEPFFCHRFFPCFDQPSIRASIKLSVLVKNQDWTLIANGVESLARKTLNDAASVESLTRDGFQGSALLERSEGWCLWDFEESPRISSYIFGLCAGEYHTIEYQSKNGPASPPVPMRMFCRRSKLQNLDYEEQFRIVCEGISFYEDLFQTKFPYAKYDQVYVPEFRIRGMENVGVICLTDRLLVDSATITEDQKLLNRRVTVHELAHMWFGDLVTMKWWNDLWLKESFADFSASSCLSECEAIAKDYPADKVHVPLLFTERALDADLKPTTHPIQVEIRHTGDGENAFDMISYAKGACWIKVMDNFVGRETLKLGMQKYFQAYSHKNTVLTDLVTCMNQAMNERAGDQADRIDLIKWTDSWLKHQGPNSLSIRSTAVKTDGKTTFKLDIIQGFANQYAAKIYREQRVDVLLYNQENPEQKLFLKDVLVRDQEVTEDIVSTQTAAVKERFAKIFTTESDDGIKIVSLVNANNKGYCQVLLDEASTEFFQSNLSAVDPLNRCYLWRILFDHVCLQKISPMEFVVAVSSHLMNETEGLIVPFILDRVAWIIENNILENQADAGLTQHTIKATVSVLVDTLLDKIENLPEAKQSERTLLMDYAIRFMPTRTCFDLLMSMASEQQLQREEGRKAISLNKLQRYACLRKCVAVADKELEKKQIQFMLEREKKQNFSDVDLIEMDKHLGAQGGEQEKFALLDDMITGKLSQQKLAAVTASFYNVDAEVGSRLADKWLENIERVEAEQHRDYFELYYVKLSPKHLKSAAHLQKLKAILDQNQANTDKALLIKLLKEDIAQMELIQAIQAKQMANQY